VSWDGAVRYHVETKEDTDRREAMQQRAGLNDALELMKDLRRRCEWDAAQTHESLRPYLIEEAYEVDDAIRAGDDGALRGELGDLLLQVLFHSVVAEERSAFDFADVVEGFLAKMKSRHPHLYEGGERQSWEGMKARHRESIVDGLPADLPSLHRAFRLQDRAAGVGFTDAHRTRKGGAFGAPFARLTRSRACGALLVQGDRSSSCQDGPRRPCTKSGA
jgi:uncharacterized protein YabN with tetrapyrrole methylase and pyrophosphatase domain